MGDEKVSSMAEKLGFDNPIAVDGSESTGTPWVSVASNFPTDASDDKLALASIGQGDTVATPLQNALVAAAVANGGKVMRPTLVDCVRSSDLSVISQTKPRVMSRAFSSDTAGKLTQMMEAVVTKGKPESGHRRRASSSENRHRADRRRQHVHRWLGDRIRPCG